MPELTAEQQNVVDQAEAFIRAPSVTRPWFAYEGQAGVGKSVVLAHLARKHRNALLCAFTGKAASVVSRKSGLHACTIHSALYRPYEDKETRELKFSRKVENSEWDGELVFVDEAGTINEWLARDLLATGCRLVICQDGGQLPPVKGRSFFVEAGADAQLLEIHRQAWDSAIIRQAHSVRSGRGYHADGPDFRIQREIGRDDLLAADIVLCYRNATRAALNRLVRAHHGFGSSSGRRGEPVMALRNNPEWGILNGAVYELQENHVNGSGVVSIVNERGEEVEVQDAWIEDFEGPVFAEDANPFAWAYAATVHKAQGSEWERVILVDEYDRADQRDRWIYTAITRASKQIIIQRFW